MSDDLAGIRALLSATLALAVPLWIERLKTKPWSELAAKAKEAADVVASKGDIIQFKSKKKGETASAFNGLAEGLAILSFAPGGVKFLELHFQTIHEGAP